MNKKSNLRRLLVGVDGSVNGHVAVDLAIQLAKEHECQLVGIDIVDEDATELALYGVADANAEEERRSEIKHMRERAKQSLEAFEQRCEEAEISGTRCRKSGEAADQIVLEAQRSDLIILGRETRFYSEWQPDSTVGIVLRQASRPIVTVPLSLPREDNVLVAYDGSRSAAQALFAFVGLGLGANKKVHVVNVSRDAETAKSIAQPALDFLELHGIESQIHAHASAGEVDKVLLNLAAKLDAGLLVAGACGHSRIREFILGSVTRNLIQESHIPTFMFH